MSRTRTGSQEREIGSRASGARPGGSSTGRVYCTQLVLYKRTLNSNNFHSSELCELRACFGRRVFSSPSHVQRPFPYIRHVVGPLAPVSSFLPPIHIPSISAFAYSGIHPFRFPRFPGGLNISIMPGCMRPILLGIVLCESLSSASGTGDHALPLVYWIRHPYFPVPA